MKNGENNKTTIVEYNTLTVFSHKLSLIRLQKWVDEKVKEYKEKNNHIVSKDVISERNKKAYQKKKEKEKMEKAKLENEKENM